MNIPGFSAEASLYRINETYSAVIKPDYVEGIVYPAQGSFLSHDVGATAAAAAAFTDVFFPCKPIPYLNCHYIDVAPPGHPPKLVRRCVVAYFFPC